MNLSQTMAELKRLGTAQNIKVYRRHGAPDPLFGVSFANVNELARKIKTDHELAQGLWATGNQDAMALATLVADPAAVSSRMLDAWARDVRYAPVGDYFVRKLVVRSRFAGQKAATWSRRKAEFVRRCGFQIVRVLAETDDDLPDSWFLPYLDQIETELQRSPNEARETMNNALVAIGKRSAGLRKKAIRVARRIGPVEIDHGETSCKTADALAELS